jgi:hypothetical protein
MEFAPVRAYAQENTTIGDPMDQLQIRRFRNTLLALLACSERLSQQLQETREHCAQVQDVMRKVRNHSRAASRYVLPAYPLDRSHAANEDQ